MRTWWRQSESHHQPDQTCCLHSCIFTFLYLCPGFWLLGKYTLWLWLTCCCTVCRISAGIIDILYVYILYITTHIYSHVCCSDHSQNDNNNAMSITNYLSTKERCRLVSESDSQFRYCFLYEDSTNYSVYFTYSPFLICIKSKNDNTVKLSTNIYK